MSLQPSHSWAYSGHYETLAEWIFEESWNVNGTPLVFNNRSVPKNDPIHNVRNAEELKQRIYAKIVASNVVICPMGMYASHSKWIDKELGGAALHRRPLLAVNPWGQERSSSVVRSRADLAVGWTKKGVVDGIWRLARG